MSNTEAEKQVRVFEVELDSEPTAEDWKEYERWIDEQEAKEVWWNQIELERRGW